MSNNLTNYAENKILDWLNPDVTAVRPTGPLKLRLYTDMPNQETGTDGVALSGNGYADTTITFSAASGGLTSNSGAVTFPTATGNQPEVVGMGVVDAGGNLLTLAELGQSKSIVNGEAFSMPIASVVVSLAASLDNLTDTWENRALDWLLVVGTPTRAATPLRVRLYSVMPDLDTGTGGTAITGNGYADTIIVFDQASSGATSNSAAVNFPYATGGNWGDVVGVDIRENGGSAIWVGPFNIMKIVNDGQTVQLPAGSVTLSLD